MFVHKLDTQIIELIKFDSKFFINKWINHTNDKESTMIAFGTDRES